MVATAWLLPQAPHPTSPRKRRGEENVPSFRVTRATREECARIIQCQINSLLYELGADESQSVEAAGGACSRRPGRFDPIPDSLLRSQTRNKFPAVSNEFPARPRREFISKELNSLMFSTRIFAKTAESAKIPCQFPASREFIPKKAPGLPPSGSSPGTCMTGSL